jgi:TPR repeat protein
MVIHKSHSASLFDEANQAWDAGDKKLAFQLFLTAAENGEEDAFNSVGYFFDHGIGTKKNSVIAYAWYRRSALRGNLAGCLNLGAWYREAGNWRRSKFWFEKAYAQGDGSAAYELGRIYIDQRGGAERALQYLTAAAKSKFVFADERDEIRNLIAKLRSKKQ